MDSIVDGIRDFLSERSAERENAAQRVALQLLCGLDLEATLAAGQAARTGALRHIERLIGRERMRGLAGHWSYDLNRHIALKQAAERLRLTLGEPARLGADGAASRDQKGMAPAGAILKPRSQETSSARWQRRRDRIPK